MSKKNYRNNELLYGYDEDYYGDRGYHDEVKQRRKVKRMKTALRQRNIHDLIELDEEF